MTIVIGATNARIEPTPSIDLAESAVRPDRGI